MTLQQTRAAGSLPCTGERSDGQLTVGGERQGDCQKYCPLLTHNQEGGWDQAPSWPCAGDGALAARVSEEEAGFPRRRCEEHPCYSVG